MRVISFSYNVFETIDYEVPLSMRALEEIIQNFGLYQRINRYKKFVRSTLVISYFLSDFVDNRSLYHKILVHPHVCISKREQQNK